MGSKTYDGVRFSVYPHDHPPPHVHGFAEGAQVIVALLPGGEVDLADREDAVIPNNTKRSLVAKILRIAAKNVDELILMWEQTHGTR